MAHKNRLEFNEAFNYFELTFKGEVELKHMLELYLQCHNHREFSLEASYLTNLTDAIPMFGFQEMRSIAKGAQMKYAQSKFTYKHAFVVNGKTDLEWAKIWLQHTATIPQEDAQLFTDYQLAKKWLESAQ